MYKSIQNNWFLKFSYLGSDVWIHERYSNNEYI